MNHFYLHVDGVPIPQGSKSVDRRGFMYEANKKTGAWRKKVTAAAKARRTVTSHATCTQPVSVRLTFVMPRPKGHWRTGQTTSHLLRPNAPLYPGVKPDVDKLVRAVFDALTVAEVWKDDALVVLLTALKRYPLGGEKPGLYIEINEPDG